MQNDSLTLGPRDADHLRWLARAGVPLAGAPVLDLGCGNGSLCAALVRQGTGPVVGVDIEPLAPEARSGAWAFVEANFDAADWGQRLPRRDFRLICGFDVIEHLSSPVNFLRSCHELLAPGGHLVLTTPNTDSWERFARGDRWSGATDAQHRILFNRYSLGFLLGRSGFEVRTITAPIRSLEKRHIPHPPFGAQLFSLSRRA